MVLFNGREVEADTIDPRKHRLLCMFRPPLETLLPDGEWVTCQCGEKLGTFDVTKDHWEQGHFDIPHYTYASVETAWMDDPKWNIVNYAAVPNYDLPWTKVWQSPDVVVESRASF